MFSFFFPHQTLPYCLIQLSNNELVKPHLSKRTLTRRKREKKEKKKKEPKNAPEYSSSASSSSSSDEETTESEEGMSLSESEGSMSLQITTNTDAFIKEKIEINTPEKLGLSNEAKIEYLKKREEYLDVIRKQEQEWRKYEIRMGYTQYLSLRDFFDLDQEVEDLMKQFPALNDKESIKQNIQQIINRSQNSKKMMTQEEWAKKNYDGP